MQAGHDVPDIFLARIRDAGGPYRVDDAIAIAIACSAPKVGRLVALEATARGRCANYERTAIPEIVSAIVEHAVAPYAAGETLTLYFVDPAIARIQRDIPEPQTHSERAEKLSVTSRFAKTVGDGGAEGREPENSVSYLSQDSRQSQPQMHEGEPMTLRADDRMTPEPDAHEHDVAEITSDERGVGERTSHERGVGEHTSLGLLEDEATPNERSVAAHTAESPIATVRVGDERTESLDRLLSSTGGSATANRTSTRPVPDAAAGIIVRLEWSAERVRRFIQVVDRLFTIDRLGWYRHSLAMRLLIPDEIRSGDELADVEAMRHLHALRTAAVSALGKPLLAACMPGFTVTSDWLETLESSREARAIAGLRDALLPRATDLAEHTDRLATVAAGFTAGTVSRRALLAESATSVESFLPILIPTQAYDAALCSRLTDYRNLLVELFAQTARATDPVRLGTLTQPNHSLDDRLWQLVGAVGEAFGGFVQT